MTQIFLEEGMLECAVCLEEFDETCRMLPCQHSFCTKCLKSIYDLQQSLRCPHCRILVNTTVDQLPRNYLLLSIIEKVKKKHSRETSDSHINNDNKSSDLQTASMIFEKEEMLKKRESDFLLEKEELEYEITLLKSKTNSTHLPKTSLEPSVFTSLENAIENIGLQSTNARDEIESEADCTISDNEDFMKKLVYEFRNFDIDSYIPVRNEYSRIHEQTFEDAVEIMDVISDKIAFNNSSLTDLQVYSDVLDRYQEALLVCSSYMDNCSNYAFDNSYCEPLLNTSNYPSDSITTEEGKSAHYIGCAKKNREANATQLFHQLSLPNDEETLLELISKRSEVTNKIDKHKANVQIIQEKIELRMAVLMSQN